MIHRLTRTAWPAAAALLMLMISGCALAPSGLSRGSSAPPSGPIVLEPEEELPFEIMAVTESDPEPEPVARKAPESVARPSSVSKPKTAKKSSPPSKPSKTSAESGKPVKKASAESKKPVKKAAPRKK